jgi:hypothetical protein
VIGGSAGIRIKDLRVKMAAQKNELKLFKHGFLLKSNCFVDKKKRAGKKSVPGAFQTPRGGLRPVWRVDR